MGDYGKWVLAGSLSGVAVGGYFGGLAGGAVVVAIGIGTGGVGLIVIGLFAAVGAYAGGELFKKGAKIGTDEINKHVD